MSFIFPSAYLILMVCILGSSACNKNKMRETADRTREWPQYYARNFKYTDYQMFLSLKTSYYIHWLRHNIVWTLNQTINYIYDSLCVTLGLVNKQTFMRQSCATGTVVPNTLDLTLIEHDIRITFWQTNTNHHKHINKRLDY